MADYFTSDHFKLLDKWQKQKRDKSNPDQNRAYVELVRAYKITESWANEIKSQLFPNGKVSIRKRPTSQGDTFVEYNWAKIYPTKSSPKELAYTVGIDAQSGFIVKIDTVGIEDFSERRKIYESLRGPFSKSPVVAILPATIGLSKSLSELVNWSIEAIKHFNLSYNHISQKMGLITMDDQLSILAHFQEHPDFVQRQPNWSADTTTHFFRLATAVHEAEFDWWFTKSTNSQLRFGLKEKGASKGDPVGWVFLMRDGLKISWKPFTDREGSDMVPLTAELADDLEKYFLSLGKKKKEIFDSSPTRQPYWPDDYIGEVLLDEDQPVALEINAFNRIYYGPPGTGKTYKLLQLLQSDYTDVEIAPDSEIWLVEQMKPLGWFEVIALVLLDGDKPLKVPDIVRHKFYQAKAVANDRTNNLTHTAWACLQRHTWSKSGTVELSLEKRAAIAVFDKDAQSNWLIVEELKEQLNDLIPLLEQLNKGPEVGAITKRYEFVTFHQSYGYEEFVEGLRPVLDDDASDQVRYEIKHGPLRQLCDRAKADKYARPYAMVIDEINRGNISKIFGELITLIEIDKRAGSEMAVPAKLPYSGDSFIIPPNVHFIGSMNTADRSLALVDTALRRRFEFKPVMPDATVLEGLVVTQSGVSIDMPQLLLAINSRIEALYDRDHTIGHAYFTNIQKIVPAEQFTELKATFQNNIIPLLEEYFFEDWQKIRLVLGDNQKDKQFQFIQKVNQEEDLVGLFGKNHELDQYAVRARYRFNEASIDLPQAYVGIYSPTGLTSPDE